MSELAMQSGAKIDEKESHVLNRIGKATSQIYRLCEIQEDVTNDILLTYKNRLKPFISQEVPGQTKEQKKDSEKSDNIDGPFLILNRITELENAINNLERVIKACHTQHIAFQERIVE